MVKISTPPTGFKSFRKAVSTVMDKLGNGGSAHKEHEPNKIGNLRVKVHFLEGDSRECLGGDEWWKMDTVGSRLTEE